jgi:RsiW-degrading membrane proteinase PrsW (M82 family)
MTWGAHTSLLRQLNPPGPPGTVPTTFSLSEYQPTLIGRGNDCQILIDSLHFRGVSRQHVRIERLNNGVQGPGGGAWQLCDLGSANGTYVNGQLVRGCVILRPGDRIMLSQNGPEYVFEIQQSLAAPLTPRANPVASYPQPVPSSAANPSFSQLIPIVSKRKDFIKKSYLLPGIATVLLVVVLFIGQGSLPLFILALALYLGGVGYSFIYRLCGKSKPWWEILIAMFATMVMLLIPPFSLIFGILALIFRGLLPGDIENAANNFFGQFIAHFFGAGLLEELFKILPVVALMGLGVLARQMFQNTRWTQALGVREPLDGILLGAASGLGFTLVETLVQYVPDQFNNAASMFSGSEDGAIAAGGLAAIQLLIPRVIGSLAGHMAYSGYFG